uniref:DNA-directed RNA polymerase n=1 Tax=Pseudothermotoga hypogea TaxID=57487 RepID=A0A832I9U1_9THEM
MRLFEQFQSFDPDILFNSFFRSLHILSSSVAVFEELSSFNKKVKQISNARLRFENPRTTYDQNGIYGRIYDVRILKEDGDYFWKGEEDSTISNVLLLIPDSDGYFRFMGRKMYSPFVVFTGFRKDLFEKEDEDEGSEVRGDILDLENSIVLQGYYLAFASTILRLLYDKAHDERRKLNGNALNALVRKMGVAYFVYFTKKDSKYLAQKIPLFFLPEGLNEVDRLSAPRRVVLPNEVVAEEKRYPNSTHFGIVDLLETPESEKIGLTLTLVDSDSLEYDFENLRVVNKKVDYESFKKDPKSIDSSEILSLATKQIPFILHSDGARILMGSKNLKQALKVVAREFPLLRTGFEKEAVGVNGFVAYGLFHGYNFEDGLVVSKTFAKRMAARVFEEEKCVVEVVNTKEPVKERTSWIYAGEKKKEIRIVWKVVENEPVFYGKLLYEVKDEHDRTISVKRYEGKYEAKVVHLPHELPLPYEDPVTKQTIVEFHIGYEVFKPLEVGDKIMGRHGNKCTVALILPDEEMPVAEFQDRLTNEIVRKPIEVLISPLSVVSRMNLGQLYETHITMAQVHSNFDMFKDRCSPLENAYVHRERLLDALKRIGSDDQGRFKVVHNGCEWWLTVGYQYFYRLDHCVRDKIHVVSLAEESKLTGQPKKGRSRHGGQRFGEMEFWCLYSYGNRKLVKLFAKKNLQESSNYPEDMLNEIVGRCVGICFETKDHMKSSFKLCELREKDDSGLLEEYLKVAFVRKHHLNDLTFLRAWFAMNKVCSRAEFERFVSELLGLLEILKKEDTNFDEFSSAFDKFLDQHAEMVKILSNSGLDLRESLKGLKDKKDWNRYFHSLLSRIYKMSKDDSSYYKGLFKRLGEFMMKKDGYIRNCVIARRLHFSARAVISPMPAIRLEDYKKDVDLDTIVLPVDFGIEWLGQKLREEENIDAEKMNIALRGDLRTRIEVAKALNRLMEKDELYVLLNRQPSLHRHSIQAFKPMFWHNYTIGLPICVCAGFNADFDGDTMAVYYPIDQNEEIKQELRKMLPSKNPFKLGNGELIYSIDQDIVYGYYAENGFRAEHNKAALKEKVKRELETLVKSKDSSSVLEYMKNVLDRYINLATKKNLTLSVFEIDENVESMKYIAESRCRGSKEQYEQLNRRIPLERRETKSSFVRGVPLEDYFDVEEGIVKRARRSLMDKKLRVAEAGYFTRKLIELLGSVRARTDIEEFVEHEIDLGKINVTGKEIFSKSRFLYRWVKDESGKVLFVEREDQLSDKFIVLSPAIVEENGDFFVSSKYCGKDLSNLKDIPDGSYIGLTAGHVLGERGTQLSMETFHTGGKGFSMGRVSSQIFTFAFASTSYQDFLRNIEKAFHEDMKSSLFEKLTLSSVYFELLYNFAQHLKKYKGMESVNKFYKDVSLRGPLTCMSFEDGLEVLKKIEIDREYVERHPRVEYAFFWRWIE